MRILIVTQWFEPEFTLKGMLLAKELVRHGHSVEVLTGFPNYPEGKLYPGYRMTPFRREKVDGISVIRCALYPSHDDSAMRRAASFLSFALSATLWGALLCRRPDVIYAYHPPITIGLPAIVLSALRRARFILDVQDLWPDTLSSTGMMNRGGPYRGVGLACRLVYRLASRIVVLSPGFKRLLVERGVPEHKISVIYNWADERHIRPLDYHAGVAERLGFSGYFNVVYAGTMGHAQDLRNVLDAAELLKARRDIRIYFYGTGVEEASLRQYAQEKSLRNVTFEGRRPIDQIQEVLSVADALLLHLKDDPLFAITIPSKTQASLCMGRPILAVCRGDAASLIEEARAGLTCPPGDAPALASQILRLYNMPAERRQEMGQNGSQYYRTALSLESGVERTLAVLDQLSVRSGTAE